MEWSRNLRKLGRGIKLATRLVKARLDFGRTDSPPAGRVPEAGRLMAFEGFGDNPGRLRMFVHLPPVAQNRPLVVLLHGCGQNAAAFAADSGWTEMADRLGFPLVLPEQVDANNAGRCFQWFRPSDTARGKGEAASIAEMTRAAIQRFGSDRNQIFILGLSAGGAMAAAMLAAYPDLFAAGASVAGLPVGTARSGMGALARMASAGPDHGPQRWTARVRALAPRDYTGPWPRLSIWQGQADPTVAPDNAGLLATQWRALHGCGETATADRLWNGVRHRTWSAPGESGSKPPVEMWSLPHLPHAYPIDTPRAEPARFVEQAPVDATAAIARFFGLN